MNKEIQKKEALERMKLLRLHSRVIHEFKDENILNYSEKGILFFLNDTMKHLVSDWEKETGNIVYHVIHSYCEFGELLSLLYVSEYQEEWEYDRNNIDQGCSLAYVMNLDDECCSEYGSIGISSCLGGLVRVF